jgi:hypothetical protein
VAAVAALLASGGAAAASCPERLGVAWGDTLSSIAQSCGVTVTSLRRSNPGLSPETLRAGTFINVPRPALPSLRAVIGREGVRIMSPLVPGSNRIASPDVVPPAPLPVYPQHRLRGFGDEPGQLPLPPGHYIRIP